MSKSTTKPISLSEQADEACASQFIQEPTDYAQGKRSSAFPTEIGSPPISANPEECQKIASLAAMRHHACQQIGKLQQKADLLVRQRNEIEIRVKLAEKIGKARFCFKPVLLKTYYLYQKHNNDMELTLTLIAPEEWNGPCPYGDFIARVRQLGDSTWEILDTE